MKKKMPMPKPLEGELKKEFIERCMSDELMQTEFNNEDQRLAICNRQWKEPIVGQKNTTYNDYPESASNNAKKALKFRDENDNPNDCGTRVGWERANQLASKESISRDTIARMASFKRHQQHKDVPYTEGCGGLMWDAWGGTSGINWAIRKLEEIDKKAYESLVVKQKSYKEYILNKNIKNNNMTKFEKAYKAYKNGEGEMPVLYKRMEFSRKANNDGSYTTTLTKEVYDRDNEVIDIKGLDLNNYIKNPVLLNNHNSTGDVTEILLGSVRNIKRDEDDMGVISLKGDLHIAETTKGKEIKKLIDGGHLNTVSIGFGIEEYDHGEKRALKSELYETSLVVIPANTGATIKNYSLKEAESRLEKAESDRKILKEYRRLFMSNKLFKDLNIEKTGDELVDLSKIYENVYTVITKSQETPEISQKTKQKEETPQKQKPLSWEKARKLLMAK